MLFCCCLCCCVVAFVKLLCLGAFHHVLGYSGVYFLPYRVGVSEDDEFSEEVSQVYVMHKDRPVCECSELT